MENGRKKEISGKWQWTDRLTIDQIRGIGGERVKEGTKEEKFIEKHQQNSFTGTHRGPQRKATA